MYVCVIIGTAIGKAVTGTVCSMLYNSKHSLTDPPYCPTFVIKKRSYTNTSAFFYLSVVPNQTT